MKRILLLLLLLSSASLWAQNSAVGPISITSTQCATIPVGDKGSTIGISVTGTWSGTLQPEVQIQNQPWTNTQVTPSTSTTAQSTITANGNYVASASGYDQFQLCGNTVGSGTATVYVIIKTTTSKAFGSGGGAPSGPAGGDLSGTYPNPTVVNINGTAFSGTSGHLVSFGAANTPADSGVVAANIVVASSPGAGVAHFAGSTQTATSSPVVGSDMGAAISMGQTTSTLVNTIRLTSNYTSSNANPTVIFTIPMAASTAATYVIECNGNYSQATADTSQQMSFQSVTTAATLLDAYNLVATGGGTFRNGSNVITSPTTSVTSFGNSFTPGALTTPQFWTARLVVTQPSGAASNFTILWTSTTGGTDVTTVYANSKCTWYTTAN